MRTTHISHLPIRCLIRRRSLVRRRGASGAGVSRSSVGGLASVTSPSLAKPGSGGSAQRPRPRGNPPQRNRRMVSIRPITLLTHSLTTATEFGRRIEITKFSNR